MSNLGLCLKEVVNIRGKRFTKKDGEYYLEITDGAGITKGGRFRKIIVQQQFGETLQNDLFWLGEDDYLVTVTTNTVSSGVRRDCLKTGIHQEGPGFMTSVTVMLDVDSKSLPQLSRNSGCR